MKKPSDKPENHYRYHRGSVKKEKDYCVRSTRFLTKFSTSLVYEMVCRVIILVCICLLIIEAQGRLSTESLCIDLILAMYMVDLVGH